MSREKIAERLRAAREAAGITQKEAADKLGVTIQAISSYERAVTRIDVESLGALCLFYEVDVDSIVNGTRNEPATSSRELTDIDNELATLLRQLTPEQAQRAIDFARGLLASR